MKRSAIWLGCIAALTCLPSCMESTPNDRAMLNLQGNVKTVVETDPATGRTTRTAFTETGAMDTSLSDTPLALFGMRVSREYGKLSAVYEDLGSEASYVFDFDKHGRLRKVVLRNEFCDPARTETSTYEYRKKERLPYRQRIVAQADGGEPQIVEGEIEYRTDEMGNWTACTWNNATVTREIEYYEPATAADNCPMTRSIDWDAVAQALVVLLVLAVSLAIIAHMVYENFIRKRLPTDYSAESFEQLRIQSGRTRQASDGENARAMECLDGIYDLWSPIPTDNGEELRGPLSHKVIKQSHLLLAQAVTECPTDEAVAVRMNEICEVLNSMQKRSFTGSKTFLATSIVLAVLMSFAMGEYQPLLMIGFSCVIYCLASMTPLFMQVRKEMRGSGGRPKFMTAIISGLFGAVATAKTYKTVTEWSDGTKTTDVDHSQTWFALIFGFVIMVILALFMWFVALISYLRNYIMYW